MKEESYGEHMKLLKLCKIAVKVLDTYAPAIFFHWHDLSYLAVVSYW